MSKLARYRKGIAAVIGAALEVIPLAYPGARWAAVVIPVLTAVAVVLTPNAAKPGAPAQ